MFENLKNILYEKKEETVCIFFNFPLDGRYFSLKATFFLIELQF